MLRRQNLRLTKNAPVASVILDDPLCMVIQGGILHLEQLKFGGSLRLINNLCV